MVLGELPPSVEPVDNEAHPELKQGQMAFAFKNKIKQLAKMTGKTQEVRFRLL